MRRAVGLLLLVPLAAAAVPAADLPPPAQVKAALRVHPLVRAAVAGVAAESANRDRLEAGPHEFVVRLAGQQRRDRPADLRYREREFGVERAVRLPGKADKDAALGAAGIEHACFALGDAYHEAARELLARWFDLQRETAAVREWAAQAELLARQHEAARKRVAAGDAARLEELLAEAQLAQIQAQQAQAEGRRERAAAELAQAFPAVALPAAVPAGELPPASGESFEVWRERILGGNHELAMARSAARRSMLAAQRLDAERLPDPTLGLKVGSERDGQERIVGVQLTIPLPGAARSAGARAGSAEADAAAAREALALARAEAELRRTFSQAQSARGQAQRLADVAARMQDNARLLDKAWRLGEGQFADLLTARRQATEAALAAAQAQHDAAEAYYRLMLDGHLLWDFDDAGEPACAQVLK